jgi:hypothetical protein
MTRSKNSHKGYKNGYYCRLQDRMELGQYYFIDWFIRPPARVNTKRNWKFDFFY